MIRKYIYYLIIAWVLFLVWLGILTLTIILWSKGSWYYYLLIPIIIFITPDLFGLFMSYERFKKEEMKDVQENKPKD